MNSKNYFNQKSSHTSIAHKPKNINFLRKELKPLENDNEFLPQKFLRKSRNKILVKNRSLPVLNRNVDLID